MKASLVKSARDAQLRDSFNKESFIAISGNELSDFMSRLYRAQAELPRTSSKLHSVVVVGSDDVWLLNFEILRAVDLNGLQDLKGFKTIDTTRKKTTKGQSPVDIKSQSEEGVSENDN